MCVDEYVSSTTSHTPTDLPEDGRTLDLGCVNGTFDRVSDSMHDINNVGLLATLPGARP